MKRPPGGRRQLERGFAGHGARSWLCFRLVNSGERVLSGNMNVSAEMIQKEELRCV